MKDADFILLFLNETQDCPALLNKSVFQHSSWLYGIILGLLLHPQ